MKVFRRGYSLLICFALLLAILPPTAEASRSHRSHRHGHRHVHARTTHVRARSAETVASYIVEVNGETYREKAPHVRHAPASLTKIMTALVVLEKCSPDQVVSVDTSAARESGSRIGLRKGDRLTVRDLLAATLMASANDACRALADHVAGNQEAFVVLMNARARTLHLENTRFTNVCGHDHVGHYSTVHDLAVMSSEALRNPLFADLVSRPAMRIATVNGGRAFTFHNLNRLIGRYPGAQGVKTGTTAGAGQCLVALARRDTTWVLVVILRARNRWRLAPAILDEAFASRKAETDRAAAEQNSLKPAVWQKPVADQIPGTDETRTGNSAAELNNGAPATEQDHAPANRENPQLQ